MCFNPLQQLTAFLGSYAMQSAHHERADCEATLCTVRSEKPHARRDYVSCPTTLRLVFLYTFTKESSDRPWYTNQPNRESSHGVCPPVRSDNLSKGLLHTLKQALVVKCTRWQHDVSCPTALRLVIIVMLSDVFYCEIGCFWKIICKFATEKVCHDDGMTLGSGSFSGISQQLPKRW